MKKPELILIPLPGSSHLVPALEFAKRLIHRHDRISITVLLMNLPFGDHHNANGTKPFETWDSRIRFIDLPQVDPPPPPQLLMTSPECYFSLLTEKNIPHVRSMVSDMLSSQSVSVVGLVVDFALVSMIDVAVELGFPSYIFFASNAGVLSLMTYLPTRDDMIGSEFRSSDSDLSIPGFVNPVPVSVLPSGFSNKESYASIVERCLRLKEVNGVIVNTFSELEPHAVNTLSGSLNPPVYTVGPLIDFKCQQANTSRSQNVLNWLDEQPESSVVFLCFGMGGSFSPAQVKEIAYGLEQSECRFLWSLRVSSPQENNYDDVLPEGFMARTKERGIICGWAPQLEVLSHRAVGGFVSHCGWNSILESLSCGVPIVTWPLYAEQKFNAFMLVKELGLAVEMRKLEYFCRKDDGDHDDLVMADEIARAVKHVMGGDSDEIRMKVKEMGEISSKSLMDGGSSFISIGQFIDLFNF